MHAGHAERSHELRRIKPGQRALDLFKLESGLLGGHFHQRPVAFLSRHGTRLDIGKSAVDAQRVEQVRRGQQALQPAKEVIIVTVALQNSMFLRREEANAGKRRQGIFIDLQHTAVGADLPYLAIEHDHLAIQMVKRPQAKIAMFLDL